MATYYRWRKSTIAWKDVVTTYNNQSSAMTISGTYDHYSESDRGASITIDPSDGIFIIGASEYTRDISPGLNVQKNTGLNIRLSGSSPQKVIEGTGGMEAYLLEYASASSIRIDPWSDPISFRLHVATQSPGTFQGYVYSINSSAYPNGGVSGSYYYDQRTTVESPTAPTNLTVPNPITSTSFTVSWQAATSNIPDYPVQSYEVLINSDASPMLAIQTVNETSADITIPTSVNGIPVTGIIVYVRAKDTNGQWGLYGNSGTTRIPVYFSPTLMIPSQFMQGQQATISWSAIEGADSYTLQRKSSTDTDWTQVYSGPNTTFSEIVGTWTTVQYRVQAVFSGTPGGWATSAEIPVVSSSALLISGTDSDLGTVVNDIPYSISTDTGNQITATIKVNGAVIFSGNVGNSTADTIPVLDLITGEGTIVISATVDASGSPVTATRTWTYKKAAITFPNSGSVAQVTKEGENIYPKVLAEGVRLPGGKTLDQVMGFPAQIYTGSYVGTGTSGASNPNTLTFPFVPKIVFIMKDPVPDFNQMVMGLFLCGSLGAEYKDRGYMYAFRGYSNSNNDAALNFPPNSQIARAKIDGNTLSWYSNDSSIQLNLNTAVYHYVALG